MSAGIRRYGVAAMLVAAALALRFALQPWLGPNVPYLQFFPAILVAAWYGGFGPGVLTTAASALAAMRGGGGSRAERRHAALAVS